MAQLEERAATAPKLMPGDALSARAEVTDAELMARLGRGDGSALALLLDRYWRPVVSYASAILDADAAEDVAQETFIRVSKSAAQWRPTGTVRAYVLRIARNLALNEKKRRRIHLSILGKARASFSRRFSPTPQQLLEERHVHDALERALAAMPERRREVFALVRFGGTSYAEASALLGTSPQTVANHMSAAMADLRRAIQPFQDSAS